ncbi:MAG: class I SAM-dependent methyltransferase [Pirellulaceae bacterium]
MTSSVADHYANHLASIYSWMAGDFDTACSHADSFYSAIGLPDGQGRIALDLGCGHSVHSIPLARRGYRVVALDTSAHLLNELSRDAGDLPIKAVCADLTQFEVHLGSEKASLIACMGDTLTHLPSCDAVRTLIQDAARNLSPDGLLTYSFRDYSAHELVGPERFLPVRSDSHRIHTYFLEYRADVVLVHDIIHTLVDSTWQMAVSAYPKIRLPPKTVVEEVNSQGLSLIYESVDRGMLYLAFRRSRGSDPS